MTDRSSISTELLDSAVGQALAHVFRILVNQPIRLVESAQALDPALPGPGIQIMGCVGFLGDIDGVIHLRFTEAFAEIASGHILGMTPEEVKAEGFDQLKDSIGELCNMSVGTFKNRLCDLGLSCKLTLPTVVRGENLHVPSVKGTTRRIYHFETLGRPLLADLQIKTE